MRKIVFGDITTVERGFVLHGCNNKGVMNSGVAKDIRETWPQAYANYAHHYETYGLQLGTIIPAYIQDDLIVVNGITQDGYGRDGKKYVSYEAIQKVVAQAGKIANDNWLTLNFPLIGAGLGGGDWAVISDIVDVTMRRYSIDTVLWIKE